MTEAPPPLDGEFAHRYRAESRGRLQTPDDILYIPGRPTLLVEVTPDDDRAWTAAFGEDDPNGLSGIFTTPDPDTVCVISGGAGYFITVDDPIREWSAIECAPVRYVLPFPKHGLIVFGSFIDLLAYRADADVQVALAWRTERLGWDDLEVTQTTDDRIEGRAWNAPDDRMVDFTVDVVTGKHEGGAFRPGTE